jgi:hypothetical protein
VEQRDKVGRCNKKLRLKKKRDKVGKTGKKNEKTIPGGLTLNKRFRKRERIEKVQRRK